MRTSPIREAEFWDAPYAARRCSGGVIQNHGGASRLLALLLGTLWLTLAGIVIAAGTALPEGVLIVHSNQRPLPAGVILDDTLRKEVAGVIGRPVELFSEFLDSERFVTAEYDKAQAEFLHRKYAGRNIRVIVAVVPQAVEFVLKQRARILPGVPVVHLSMSRELLPALGLPSEFVGATIDLDPTPTIELALRLQPAATRLVIVTGASERDRVWERRIHDAMARFGNRLDVEYLNNLPTPDVLRRLGALPANTIIYTPGYFADGTGRVITPRQSVQQMAEAANAPLYGPFDTFLGTGVVGGFMSTYEDQARKAAAIVVRLLNGEAPAAIPAMSMQSVPIVDWRQLRRWKMDERLLPPSAIVKFRAPSLWEEHRRWILIAALIVTLQAALIAALLFQRRLQKRTAAELAQSEQHMNLAARAARLTMWIWDVTSDKVWATPRSRRQPAAPDERSLAFAGFLESVHPADRENVRRAAREALAKDAEFDTEYRVTGRDGKVHWLVARGRPERGPGPRLVGVAIDITARKRAELQSAQDRAALRHMTRVSMLGQLSASIAHQLNQPLAAILGNAEAAQKMLERERIDVAELREICDDIVTEDHRAAEVIRRLRDLYKRGEMNLEPLDVNALVGETLGLVSTELLTRHVSAVTDVATSLPLIDAGRVQLQQVLLNLIMNAADAMSGNAPDDRIVTVRTEAAGTEIRLTVVDRGSGIAAENLQNVFDAFWTTKHEGMGVGLAICQTIVAAHGGRIAAVNNPDGGATFCVTLPVRAAA